jgi:hemerythrin HHE cation binding domain-containing protein
MDVLTRLSREHADLRIHIERIASAAEARDALALATNLDAARAALTSELDSHITVEETEAFAAMGEDLVAPFYAEHMEIRALRDAVFAQLKQGETPYGLSLDLCELVLAHQQREDLMLFPSVREALGRRGSPGGGGQGDLYEGNRGET